LGLLGLGRSAGGRTKGEESSGGGACELAYGILRWMIEFDMRTDQTGGWPPARIASACRSLMAFRSAQWPAWSPGDDTGRNERCVSQRRRLRTDCPARAIRGRHCRATSLRTLIVELDSNGRPYSQATPRRKHPRQDQGSDRVQTFVLGDDPNAMGLTQVMATMCCWRAAHRLLHQPMYTVELPFCPGFKERLWLSPSSRRKAFRGAPHLFPARDWYGGRRAKGRDD
jgi:hypothetical protein